MKIKCPCCNTEFTKDFQFNDFYDSYRDFGEWNERKWSEIFNSNFTEGEEIHFVEGVECPECENSIEISMVFAYKDLKVQQMK